MFQEPTLRAVLFNVKDTTIFQLIHLNTTAYIAHVSSGCYDQHQCVEDLRYEIFESNLDTFTSIDADLRMCPCEIQHNNGLPFRH